METFTRVVYTQEARYRKKVEENKLGKLRNYTTTSDRSKETKEDDRRREAKRREVKTK